MFDARYMVWRSFLFTRPPSIQTERIMLTNQRKLPHRANYRRKNKKRTERRRNENVRVNNGKIKRESQTKRVCGMVSVEEVGGRGYGWRWTKWKCELNFWCSLLLLYVLPLWTNARRRGSHNFTHCSLCVHKRTAAAAAADEQW